MTVESWKSIFDLATVALLFLTFAAGAGVLITGNIINSRQKQQLQTFDSDLTAAKSGLAKQQERAAKAEAQIASAQADAAEANLQIAKANERTAGLEVQAAQLRVQLSAQQRRSNVLLDQPIRSRFVAHIASFKGQRFDISACGLKESEIAYFSMSMWSTLEGAGWTVGANDTKSPSCHPGVLVVVDPNASQRTRDAAHILLLALVEAGLAPNNSIVSEIPPPPANADAPGTWYLHSSHPDSLVILIGTHP